MKQKYIVLLMSFMLILTNFVLIAIFIFLWNTMSICVINRFVSYCKYCAPITMDVLNVRFDTNDEIISLEPRVEVLGNPFSLLMYVKLEEGIDKQVFLKSVTIRKLSDNSIVFVKEINKCLIFKKQDKNSGRTRVNNLYLPPEDLKVDIILEIDGKEERIQNLKFKFSRKVYRSNRILDAFMGV